MTHPTVTLKGFPDYSLPLGLSLVSGMIDSGSTKSQLLAGGLEINLHRTRSGNIICEYKGTTDE